jgi:lipoprotein-anchoring transpeptidase ErfK/SrfK
MGYPTINRSAKFNRFILWVFLISLIFSLTIVGVVEYFRNRNRIQTVLVDKHRLVMKIINFSGDTIETYPVAVGTNLGDKEKVGDLKTPEGTFGVVTIEDASAWKYDFEDDGKGPVDGAYGPWFVRLKVTNHKGIGIHGTHDNTTIGKRVSHGCIRMKNEDLQEIVPRIREETNVIITKDTLVLKNSNTEKK